MPRWSGICVSIRACFHSSHVVLSLTALTNTEFVFSKPDAPLRTAQWDRARLAQFCSCPLPQASKNAKSIRIYQKILQFNLAHLIEIIFLQIFPQSISLIVQHFVSHFFSRCVSHCSVRSCHNMDLALSPTVSSTVL